MARKPRLTKNQKGILLELARGRQPGALDMSKSVPSLVKRGLVEHQVRTPPEPPFTFPYSNTWVALTPQGASAIRDHVGKVYQDKIDALQSEPSHSAIASSQFLSSSDSQTRWA